MSELIHDSIPEYGYAEVFERLRLATLGRYDLYGELGRGGMAVVYLALDLALNRKVAIKAILPEVASHSGAIERFRREVRTSASLSHPHIIPIYAVGDESSLAYFVMKYVAGRGLDTVIRDEGAQSPEFVHTILQQIGLALDYAHQSGVVHRDVKAANIMLDDGGWALLTDFGIAKATDSPGLTSSGMIVGTPSYMAPEQFSGENVGPAADQYALGCVAFELLAGRRPMVGGTVAELMRCHLLDPPPRLVDLVPSCPPELDACIQRMLAKRPEQRFASIHEALATLHPPSKDAQARVTTTISRLASTGSELRPAISQPVSPSPGRSTAGSRPATTSDKTPPPGGVRFSTAQLLLASAAVVLLTVMAVRLPRANEAATENRSDAPQSVVQPVGDSLSQDTGRARQSAPPAARPPAPVERTPSAPAGRDPVARVPNDAPRPTRTTERDTRGDTTTAEPLIAPPVEQAEATVPTPADANTPGALRIGTRLTGGFLYINDEIIALPTAKLQRFPLSPGRHRLRITTNGCVSPWEQVVDVRPGEVLTFNYITPQCDPRP